MVDDVDFGDGGAVRCDAYHLTTYGQNRTLTWRWLQEWIGYRNGLIVRWVWNDDKNRANKRKHSLSFEAARYVFRDPLALTRLDNYPEEERY